MGGTLSSVGNMFGAGDNGLNFQAKSTDILTPTTGAQAGTAYDQSQDALKQQAAFLAALQGQNGVQNQSDVYNQMSGVASGQGPNPAQAMLNQATGNNIASTAALMAGQRGVSQNPGMIARQIGQMGANTNQQAAGQGAVMQANQSMNALNAMGNMAGQQVANQAGATQNYNAAAQSEQQNLLNAIQGQNNANVGMQGNMNSANAGVSEALIPVQNKNIGSVSKMLPIVGGMFAQGGEVPAKFADGGAVMPMASGPQSFVGQHFALFNSAPSAQSAMGGPQIQGAPQAGVQPAPADNSPSSPAKSDPTSLAGNPFERMSGGLPGGSADGVMAGGPMDAIGGGGAAAGGAGGAAAAGGSMAELAPLIMVANKGGAVPKKAVNGEMLAAKGKEVPGKAKVKGDSLANDTVAAKLSPGEIVIPRSIAQGKDAPAKAAAFVAAVLARKGRMPARGV